MNTFLIRKTFYLYHTLEAETEAEARVLAAYLPLKDFADIDAHDVIVTPIDKVVA